MAAARAARTRATSRQKSRLRLIVVQAIVLSLFVTLFARLWYLQVLGGEAYQAQAADQSVREIVVQPARGLIVDDMGRPLVANRTSWVVTVDRTLLKKMDAEDQEALLRRVARTVGSTYKDVLARTLLCGEPDAVSGTCWNGSPYQPVPVAEDVPQETAVSILEQSENYPAVLAESASVRAYPSPYGINAAHLLGYLSPITEEELDEAEAEGDTSVHGASVVGRAGVEKQYDRFLRGEPGYKRVAVDSMGRVLGDSGEVEGRAGDTLVTSIDARVQAVVEQQLEATIKTARQTVDRVSGRKFVADSGAAVVLDVTNGRIVAAAGHPTYDPGVWVGGISRKDLARLYSQKAGTPLLFRATQGQFAPGSTWKPFMAAGALENGYNQTSRLDCSSAFTVGNRAFKNYESGAYGSIGFDRALEVSCNTFFYRIGYNYWQKWGSDVTKINARDPLVSIAKDFGFGKETGIDLPGEASGRIADRRWKRDYYEANKDYYCDLGKKPGNDFLHRFAREFCIEGFAYRAGDAVNFSIGQGDTIVTPLQLARGYAALGNGGILWEPRVGRAVVDPNGNVIKEIKPKKAGSVKVAQRHLDYIDSALHGVSTRGTMSWRLIDFPLDKVKIRSKTGSAEVYGKQSTSWVASYDKRYAVVMMVSQGGTGSGTSGPAIRKIWETLYGVRGNQVVPAKAALPGAKPPAGLPVFAADGEILPPAARTEKSARNEKPARARQDRRSRS
jgi:penicillin-binding protein 2